MTSKIQTNSLTDGRLLYLPFNGKANDESGNGHITTVYGATLTSDRFGNSNQAYHFSAGSNIMIQNSNALNIGTGDYSIVAWVKLDKVAQMRIYNHGSGNCNPNGPNANAAAGYMLRTNQYNQLHQEFTCTTGQCGFGSVAFSDGKQKLSVGQWYFVANTVQRSSDSIIYINGIVDSTIKGGKSCDIAYNNNPLVGFSPTEALYGDVDDLMIYNRALSKSEIQELYTITQSPTPLPSQMPTTAPTIIPTLLPTKNPTLTPTNTTTQNPTLTPTTFYTDVSVAVPNYSGSEKNEHFIISIETNNIVTGGGGCDKYTFFSHPAVTTTITDFSNVCCVIDLRNIDISSYQDLKFSYSPIVLTLPNDQKIVFQGIDEISEGSFILSSSNYEMKDEANEHHNTQIPSWVAPVLVSVLGSAFLAGVGFLLKIYCFQNKQNNSQNKPPIGISLDGNEIEIVKFNNSTVKFDYYNNYNPVKTSWVGAKDAILVYDHNDNRKVDFAKEIVLTEWGADAKTDFEALLSNFDTNKDKIFNKEDQEFSKFYLWQDKNQDGVSQNGELRSLEEAGILSIDFNTQEEIYGELRELGALNKAEVLWEDGRVSYAYDLVFTHDVVQ